MDNSPINWKWSFPAGDVILKPFQQHTLYHVRVTLLNQIFEVLNCFRGKNTFDAMQNCPFNSSHVIRGAALYQDFRLFPCNRSGNRIYCILIFLPQIQRLIRGKPFVSGKSVIFKTLRRYSQSLHLQYSFLHIIFPHKFQFVALIISRPTLRFNQNEQNRQCSNPAAQKVKGTLKIPALLLAGFVI